VGASAGAFGLVAAFAMLYPERSLMLLLFFIIPISIRAKFLLLFSALLAVFGIVFPYDNIANAAHLGGMLMGIIFVRYIVHWNWRMPQMYEPFRPGQLRRKFAGAASQKPALWKSSAIPPEENLSSEEFLSKEVDPILDKISAHGIQSLTERERKILEAARAKMAKR
jgi:rhomboid family protein